MMAVLQNIFDLPVYAMEHESKATRRLPLGPFREKLLDP
jgi:hypothetical protein